MVKILHTADLHIGAKFDSLPKEKAEILRNSHVNAVLSMVEHANREKIDFILIAGDLFHSNDVDPTLFSLVSNALAKAEMPVLVCAGNHDFISENSPYKRFKFTDNVHLFHENTLSVFENEKANFYGASFTDEYAEISLYTELDTEKVNICLIHADILTQSKYNALTPAKLAVSEFDYIAVGHNHEFSGLIKNGKTAYASSGCLTSTGFDELNEKGYLLLEIDKGIVKCDFYRNPWYHFEIDEINATNLESDVEIIEKLQKIMHEYSEKAIARIYLTGKIAFKINPKTIFSAVEDKVFHLEIIDNTAPQKNLWDYCSDEGICGEFARILREKFDESDDNCEKEQILEALELGLIALDKQI